MKLLMLINMVIYSLAIPFSVIAFTDNFDDGKDDGWVVAAGKWEVKNGEYRAPVEVNTPPYPLTYALDGKEFAEFTIEAKVRNDKFHSTMNQSHAGFAYGMDATNTGYVIYFRFHRGLSCPATASLVIRYTIENGKSWVPNADVAEGCNVFEAGDKEKWHVLKAEINANKGTVRAWVDGNLSIDAKMKINPGRVGLWVADIGAGSFDDVSITGPGILAVRSDSKIAYTWGLIKNYN